MVSKWKRKITKICEEVGTMRPAFVPLIELLAQIMEQREITYKQYLAEGGKPVVTRVSDRGAENLAKNPLLRTWQDLNDQAITVMRELGLTPKGLNQLEALSLQPQDSFTQYVNNLEKELEQIENDN